MDGINIIFRDNKFREKVAAVTCGELTFECYIQVDEETVYKDGKLITLKIHSLGIDYDDEHLDIDIANIAQGLRSACHYGLYLFGNRPKKVAREIEDNIRNIPIYYRKKSLADEKFIANDLYYLLCAGAENIKNNDQAYITCRRYKEIVKAFIKKNDLSIKYEDIKQILIRNNRFNTNIENFDRFLKKINNTPCRVILLAKPSEEDKKHINEDTIVELDTYLNKDDKI